MKFLATTIIGIFLFGCGGNSFQTKPTIKKRSLAAGRDGAQENFNAVLAKADNMEGPDAGDKVAALLVESQFSLMSVNGTEGNISSGSETGICLVQSGDQLFEDSDIGENLLISKKGRVVYSVNTEMTAAECQEFFRIEIPGKIRKEFFDLHVSFYSLSF